MTTQHGRSWYRGAGLWAAAASVGAHAGLLSLAGAVAHFGPVGEGGSPAEVWAISLDLSPQGGPGPTTPTPPGGQEEEDFPPDRVEPPAGAAVALPEALPGTPGVAVGPPTPGNGGNDLPQSRGGGTPTFFQLPLKGTSVVFLIDRSLSMHLCGGLSAAKREVIACLGQLPASAQFQVILYSRDPICVGNRKALIEATPDNLAMCRESIEACQAQGSTNHLDAIRLGLSMEPETLVIVTDAADLTAAQVSSLTNQNHRGTRIHTMAWGPNHSPGSPLQRLAEMNGGSHKILLP